MFAESYSIFKLKVDFFFAQRRKKNQNTIIINFFLTFFFHEYSRKNFVFTIEDSLIRYIIVSWRHAQQQWRKNKIKKIIINRNTRQTMKIHRPLFTVVFPFEIRNIVRKIGNKNRVKANTYKKKKIF